MKDVLSLFDGMSYDQIALNCAGMSYENYYSSEIDKFAIAVTQHNYPNTIQLGDITKWCEWDIDWSRIDAPITEPSKSGLIQEEYIRQDHRGARYYNTEGKSVPLASRGGGWGMKTDLYLTPIGATSQGTVEDLLESGDALLNARNYRQFPQISL